jgi:hypothetical protein
MTHCSRKCLNTTINRNRSRNPSIRIRNILRKSLKNAIKNRLSPKPHSILKYFGCSHRELVVHLESRFHNGMNWSTYGVHGWHVDHHIPMSAFDLAREDHRMVCFNWRNLRPLGWVENIRKGNSIPSDVSNDLRNMAESVGVFCGVK